MSWLCRYSSSSIGKKQMMALTGLLLCGFLVTHLAANLLIIFNPEGFNLYAHSLMSKAPFIYLAEIALGLLFIAHIVLALRVVWENRAARPEPYFLKKKTGRGATIFSSTMVFSGVFVFVFLVIHIINFRFGPHYTTVQNGVEMRDLYRLVVEHFRSPLYSAYYVLTMVVLGFHLAHGFQSAFKTLGVCHPKYSPLIGAFSYFFATVIAVGFAAIPIWIYFFLGGN